MRNEKPIKISNKYQTLMPELSDDDESEDDGGCKEDDEMRSSMPSAWNKKVKVHRIAEIKAEKLTRTSAMKFNEAKVRRPLASAVQVEAGNLVVLEEDGGYIENKQTKERVKVRVEKIHMCSICKWWEANR